MPPTRSTPALGPTTMRSVALIAAIMIAVVAVIATGGHVFWLLWLPIALAWWRRPWYRRSW